MGRQSGIWTKHQNYSSFSFIQMECRLWTFQLEDQTPPKWSRDHFGIMVMMFSDLITSKLLDGYTMVICAWYVLGRWCKVPICMFYVRFWGSHSSESQEPALSARSRGLQYKTDLHLGLMGTRDELSGGWVYLFGSSWAMSTWCDSFVFLGGRGRWPTGVCYFSFCRASSLQTHACDSELIRSQSKSRFFSGISRPL